MSEETIREAGVLGKSVLGNGALGSEALANAWARYATFDHNAMILQRQFLRLRIWMLVVGVLAIALAIVYSLIETSNHRPEVSEWRFTLWLLVMGAPILGTVLATGASKMARGASWVQLRGAAETAKREIYRFRCRAGAYAAEAEEREEALAETISAITGRLMDSEVLSSSLIPYRGQLPPKRSAEGDDGSSVMDAPDYLQWRLQDQLDYFAGKSKALDRRHRVSQWAIAILGGSGTLLAAVGMEIWVPVSVGLATALTSYLELRNVENNLAGFNRGALELENVKTWWSGLPASRHGDRAVLEALVERTEAILTSEHASWTQGMQEAVANVSEGESETECPECQRRQAEEDLG